MTTLTAPAWAPWTNYYDPAGQGPSVVSTVDGDGLNVKFWLDRLSLSLQGAPDAPLTGATALSGAVAVDVPESFDMLGFLLVANGHLDKTPGGQGPGDLLHRARHPIPAVATHRSGRRGPGPGIRVRLPS